MTPAKPAVKHVRASTRARSIAALSVVLISIGLVPGIARSSSADHGPSFVAGSGTSYAQVYRVGPTAGQLSLAPVIGLTLADYVDAVGRGESKLADWAGIGVAERQLPDNTPDIKVASTEKGAEKGKTTYVFGGSDGSNGGGVAELYARATKAPRGESRFRLASFEIPGLVEVRGAESYTSAGIVDGPTREAVAVTKIGVLSIAGGAVTLNGLRWESIQRTGASKALTAKFSIEGATIGGVPLSVPAGGSDVAAIIGPINTALAPSGLRVSLPVSEKQSGQAGETPLSIDIKNSPAGRQFVAPILEAAQPIREPVADQFIALAKQLESYGFPDASVAVLLADLSLGILSGSSQLHMEFGGVTAYTEGQAYESPFGRGTFSIPQTAVAGTKTVYTPGKPGSPAVPGGEVSDRGELAAAPSIAGTKTIPGGKGGAAVAVGLIGLGAAIALGAADWLRMRASRRAAGA